MSVTVENYMGINFFFFLFTRLLNSNKLDPCLFSCVLSIAAASRCSRCVSRVRPMSGRMDLRQGVMHVMRAGYIRRSVVRDSGTSGAFVA